MTADELRALMAGLPPLPDELSPWDEHRKTLRTCVADLDPEEFLSWPVIQATMFVGNAPYIKDEYASIYFDSRGVRDPGFGNPPMWDYHTSGNYIHQAYHLQQWEDTTGRRVKDLETIIEVGGGYGAMAVIARYFGFEGEYIIFDLPEFTLLQRYYLSNVGYDNHVFFISRDKGPLTLPVHDTNAPYDLMIGLFSLGEITSIDRYAIIEFAPANSYLLSFAPSWGTWDNMLWAREMFKRTVYNWVMWTIPHLVPNVYLVGAKQ